MTKNIFMFFIISTRSSVHIFYWQICLSSSCYKKWSSSAAFNFKRYSFKIVLKRTYGVQINNSYSPTRSTFCFKQIVVIMNYSLMHKNSQNEKWFMNQNHTSFAHRYSALLFGNAIWDIKICHQMIYSYFRRDIMNVIINGSLCHMYHYMIQVINFGQGPKVWIKGTEQG